MTNTITCTVLKQLWSNHTRAEAKAAKWALYPIATDVASEIAFAWCGR